MNLGQTNLAIRKKLASFSNTDENDWFLCLKARYGMASVFKAIRSELGSGEIVTTPYTCITSVNPIIVAELKPVYADIAADTLSISNPLSVITKRTHGVIVQHTLGIINNESNKIAKICKDKNLLFIEDSAHCLSRMAVDTKGNPLADISIHSFGVEKVLQNTKFGGAIYVNPKLKDKNPKLYASITNKLLSLPDAPRTLDLKIRAYRTQNAILQRLPNSMKNSFRDAMVKTKTFEPAVQPFEQAADQGKSYNITSYAANIIMNNLPSLPGNYKRREQNVATYNIYLQKAKDFHIISDSKEPMLAFPIVFEDARRATAAYNALASSGYFIRRWYSPLLYPGPTDNRYYSYDSKKCPVAESIHMRVLCLPTNLSTLDTKKIISILRPTGEKPVNSYKTEK